MPWRWSARSWCRPSRTRSPGRRPNRDRRGGSVASSRSAEIFKIGSGMGQDGGMEMLTSADGTAIAVESVGSGPAVLLIGGAFNDRSTVAGLAAELADHTAWSYDRRGRGDSGPLGPCPGAAGAVEQELADLAAVLAVARPVVTIGHSS